ncbi:MAG: hypothetical protein QXK27_03265 [Candidatus Hadarchaeales archaeon]
MSSILREPAPTAGTSRQRAKLSSYDKTSAISLPAPVEERGLPDAIPPTTRATAKKVNR